MRGNLFQRLKAALQNLASSTQAPPSAGAGRAGNGLPVSEPAAGQSAESDAALEKQRQQKLEKQMEEFYARQREKEKAAEEADRQRAREVLAKFPPPPAGQPRNLVKVFGTAPDSPAASGQGVTTVEGVVFDTYPVLGSRMDDSDGYDGFDVISGDDITSWRKVYWGIEVGKAVRIKYVRQRERPHNREDDDEILEVWVEE